MNIAIVKYNAGNIQSVLYALERIGMQAIVTDDPEAIRSADKVIFPGVGEASSAMSYLKEHKLDNERFLKSFKYYTENPAKLKIIYDSVAVILIAKRDKPDTLRAK